MREKDLQTHVMRIARKMSWKPFHQYYSVGSESGFPDLVLGIHPDLVSYPEWDPYKGFGKPVWDDYGIKLPQPPFSLEGFKCVVAELKTVRGLQMHGLRQDQIQWLDMFKSMGVPTFVWTENHLHRIPDILARIALPFWARPDYDWIGAARRKRIERDKERTPF